MFDKTSQTSMKVGEQFTINCVRVRGLAWISEAEWLPVIGPLHDDAEFLNFAVEHYHIDWRFVDPAPFAKVSHEYASEGQTEHLLGLVIGRTQIIAGPTERRMTVHRLMPVYPIRTRDGEGLPYFCALEEAFTDWVLDPAIAICPHRGLPLAGLADENGIAVCPGHGLAWDMKTGQCVRRFMTVDGTQPPGYCPESAFFDGEFKRIQTQGS